jgi:hypothetical protein
LFVCVCVAPTSSAMPNPWGAAPQTTGPTYNNPSAAGQNPFLGGGMGGGPDLSSMLNNPAMMNMATQMMADPDFVNQVRLSSNLLDFACLHFLCV